MILEIFAVLFTLACVYLTTKNKVSSWPIGIIGVVLYLILFFQVNLYAEVITQIVFLIQSFYGWYNWATIKEKLPAPITQMLMKEKIIWISVIFTSTIILWQILIHTNASIPLVDSFTTSISLVANWLLAKRKLENWWLWIFVDLIYIVMFTYKMLFLTASLYTILFFLAIYGYKNWRKEYHINRVQSLE